MLFWLLAAKGKKEFLRQSSQSFVSSAKDNCEVQKFKWINALLLFVLVHFDVVFSRSHSAFKVLTMV